MKAGTLRNRALLVIILSWLPISLTAQSDGPTLQSNIQQKLHGTTLSLRQPVVGSQLHFAINGALLGKYGHGIFSLDRDLVVNEARLTSDALIITGQRVFHAWDLGQNRLDVVIQPDPTVVTLDLPNENVTETTLEAILRKVFLTSDELTKLQCGPKELAALTDVFEIGKTPNRKFEFDVRDPTYKPGLRSVCFPSGGRGYPVTRYMRFPKPVYSPDPKYEAGDQAKGTAVDTYAIAIDDSGLVSDALLFHAAGQVPRFRGAVALRNWTFIPAQYGAQRIPTVLRIDMKVPVNP